MLSVWIDFMLASLGRLIQIFDKLRFMFQNDDSYSCWPISSQKKDVGQGRFQNRQEFLPYTFGKNFARSQLNILVWYSNDLAPNHRDVHSCSLSNLTKWDCIKKINQVEIWSVQKRENVWAKKNICKYVKEIYRFIHALLNFTKKTGIYSCEGRHSCKNNHLWYSWAS